MPQGIVPISQREITITRSVVRDCIKSLIKQLDFPDDSEIIFNELQGAVRLSGSTWKRCETKIKTDYRNYVFAGYREQYMPSGYNRDNMGKNQHKHIFQDRETGFYVIPHYSTMKSELSLRFRSKDYTTITKLVNFLKASNTERSFTFKHDLNYDYNIPDKVLYLAYLTHTLRSKVGGEDMPLKDYLKTRFSEGVTIRENATGTAKQAIKQECQMDVLGMCEEEAPYNIINISEDVFEVEIPYVFYYRQPTAIEIVYPIIVHNQFVGKKVVNMIQDQDKNVSDKRHVGWTPLDYFNMGSKDNMRYYRPDGGKRLIEFDEWYPSHPYPGTTTLCIAPVMVSEDDNKQVADLDSLPDNVLDPAIKEYLRENITYQGKAPLSLIHLEVFETYGMERSLDFTIDENLNIRTLADLDPRYRVHLRVSLINDWSVIPNQAMRRLLYQPDLCFALAKHLDRDVKMKEINAGGPTRLRGTLINFKGRITNQSMRDWLVTLPSVNEGFKRAPTGFMQTVMTANTIAKRGI